MKNYKEQEQKHLKELEHLFSLNSSIDTTRIHNSGEDISMEKVYEQFKKNLNTMNRKISEAMRF